MRRLHPDSDPVDPIDLLPRTLRDADTPVDRPRVVVNFISSVDGRATIEGRSTGLGNEGDRRIFRALRGCADAVLAGTGTIGAEHYGTLAREPEVVALRDRLGLPSQPPLVTITRSGRIPEIPLLADEHATLIVYTGAEVTLPAARATVRIERRDPPDLRPERVLGDLHERYGVRLLLCEGGPSLFSELAAAGCCDELFLTLAPLLVGGGGGSITGPASPRHPYGLRLLWALEQDDSLYLRYAMAAEPLPHA